MPVSDLQAIDQRRPIQFVSENLGQRHRVTLAGGTPLPMDRDFELVWQLRPSATAEVAVFTQTHHGVKHALLLAVPPVGDCAGSSQRPP